MISISWMTAYSLIITHIKLLISLFVCIKKLNNNRTFSLIQLGTHSLSVLGTLILLVSHHFWHYCIVEQKLCRNRPLSIQFKCKSMKTTKKQYNIYMRNQCATIFTFELYLKWFCSALLLIHNALVSKMVWR